MRKMKILLVIFIMFFMVLDVLPQSQTKPKEEPKKVAPKKEEVKEEIDPNAMEGASSAAAIAEQEEKSVLDDEITSGDFIYQPRGRRDPFWDLLRGKSVKIKREAKEGIAGLLIDELELEGILYKQGKYIALFKGPDGRPYDVKVGDSVYDGEIIDIDVNAVVFKRILTIALGGTKEKLITIRLTPEEEASKQ